MKVKIFSSKDDLILEKQINDWLEQMKLEHGSFMPGDPVIACENGYTTVLFTYYTTK